MHVIFVVQAYANQDDRGGLSDVVVCEVFADSEQKAIEKAKKYINRDHYRVSSIIEKNDCA